MSLDIDGKVREVYEQERRVFPCRSNRASQMGHPCIRYLTYMRKDWEKKTLPSVELLWIFEGGGYIEELATARLKKAGFLISSQQRDFEDKKAGITGHIDGYIATAEEPTKTYPLEIKGINQFDFEKINSPEDMLKSKKVWLKGYPSQLMLYLFLSEKEQGCFYLVNKATLQGKTLWMNLDFDYCEELLKKAEKINTYIGKDGAYPERMPYDPDVCSKCDFAHICTPEANNPSRVAVEDDEELEAMLSRRAELEPLSKEYVKLDASIKEIGKQMDRENLIIGDWIISRKPYTINRKPSPGGEYKGIKVSIQRLGGENDKG